MVVIFPIRIQELEPEAANKASQQVPDSQATEQLDDSQHQDDDIDASKADQENEKQTTVTSGRELKRHVQTASASVYKSDPAEIMKSKAFKEYTLKDIIDWRFKAGTRPEDQEYEFLAQWAAKQFKGESTWEPEWHFEGSIELLKAFKERHQLGTLKYKGALVGDIEGVGTGPLDRSIWADIGKVVEKITVFLDSLKYQTSNRLSVVSLDRPAKQLDQDTIVALRIDDHCFVGLFIKQTKRALVADGLSVIFRDDYMRRVRRFFPRGTKLIPVIYDSQSYKGHCASSAVLIGIELGRLYKTYDLNTYVPDKLDIPRKLRLKITNEINNGRGEKLARVRKGRELHRCPRCGWAKLTSNRQPLSLHMLNCKQ